jgi:hypothetical protein
MLGLLRTSVSYPNMPGTSRRLGLPTSQWNCAILLPHSFQQNQLLEHTLLHEFPSPQHRSQTLRQLNHHVFADFPRPIHLRPDLTLQEHPLVCRIAIRQIYHPRRDPRPHTKARWRVHTRQRDSEWRVHSPGLHHLFPIAQEERRT